MDGMGDQFFFFFKTTNQNKLNVELLDMKLKKCDNNIIQFWDKNHNSNAIKNC